MHRSPRLMMYTAVVGNGLMRAMMHSMTRAQRRMQREQRTVEAMIRLYCRSVHHTTSKLCNECHDLAEFANLRLSKCPFQDNKPTCAKCPIHCYKPERREQMKAVMRFAGPRMMWKHPIIAIRHMLDARREVPPIPKSGGRTNPSSDV